MELNQAPTGADALSPTSSRTSGNGVTRKRSTSGAGGLLSKIPFMRSSADHHRPRSRPSTEDLGPDTTSHSAQGPTSDYSLRGAPTSMSNALQHQQQKTRRRRGSLRKVALLGRGAQRERRESRSLGIEAKQAIARSVMDGAGGAVDEMAFVSSTSSLTDGDKTPSGSTKTEHGNGYGLGISDITPRPSMDGYASRTVSATPTSPASGTASAVRSGEKRTSEPLLIPNAPQQNIDAESTLTSPTISYSTTDDEDALHMSSGLRPGTPSVLRPERSSMSSGSDSYFPGPSTSGGSSSSSHALPSIQRRRSATTQRAKSPLALTSLAGLSTTPLPQQEPDWDYAETEWWGWVVLVVTWTVFVTGMGSCLGVWSWAWDVGTTPYAPPELEDDPTLPIVGYYPALIILTGVMAWVWVVIAWVGMKYFRHARVSGD